MAALVSDYATRIRVLERAVQGRELKAILDRKEYQRGDKAQLFVSDLRTEVFECNEEAAQLNEISGEAWETAEWLRTIQEALEGHLNEARTTG